MPVSDYLGADRRGHPLPLRVAPFAGRKLPLAPLTTAQVIELHSQLFEFQDIAVCLIYHPWWVTNFPTERLYTAAAICLRVLFPLEWEGLVEAAAVAAERPGGPERLFAEVGEILKFYRGAHDWKRIFGMKSHGDGGLLGISGVKDNVVQYRKPRAGRLSFEASHMAACEAGSPHVFEMLQWRPEAYLSEIDAARELRDTWERKPGEVTIDLDAAREQWRRSREVN